MAGDPICAFSPGRGAVEQNGENGTHTWYEKLSVSYVPVAGKTPLCALGHTRRRPVDILFIRAVARTTASTINKKGRVGSPLQNSLAAAQFWEPAFPGLRGKKPHVSAGPVFFGQPGDSVQREIDEIDPRKPP